MKNCISTAVYMASQVLSANGLIIRRAHLTEVLAALLGYRTYAALISEELAPTLDYHLEDAEIFVLNLPMGAARVAELKLLPECLDASVITTACVDAFRSSVDPTLVYTSVADFYESYVINKLAEIIYFDDNVASGMAETNASFPDYPEMDDTYLPGDDLWASVHEWMIEAQGVMTGEYDPEDDRMFTGDTVNCRGRLVYSKAGRAGLVFLESDATGGADDSWRDADCEAEIAFQESLDSQEVR